MLSASFSQSMVTLFASYSALGGFGLGLLHHHPEYNHQFFINYSDHPHHWASKLWSWSKMSIPHPKNLLNLLFTFFSFRNHSEHQQYNLCNASSPLPPLFWFSSSKGFLYLPAVVASQGHFTRYIIQNTGLQLWIIRFHKLQWIAVITCTSCEFWEAFLFFISHIHINHIQSCVHFGADTSTLFCLKLSGKIIGGLFHVLELKHWAYSYQRVCVLGEIWFKGLLCVFFSFCNFDFDFDYDLLNIRGYKTNGLPQFQNKLETLKMSKLQAPRSCCWHRCLWDWGQSVL